MLRRLILTLLLLPMSAQATNDNYTYVYIPIIFPQDLDEITLYKGIFYTWIDEPEFTLQAVTRPYIINSPHSNDGGMYDYFKDADINVANIKGLEINLSKLDKKKCSVGIDTRKVSISPPDTKPIEKDIPTQKWLDYVVEHVKKATKLNLAMYHRNCDITVIKKTK